jgi:hypothetical protein
MDDWAMLVPTLASYCGFLSTEFLIVASGQNSPEPPVVTVENALKYVRNPKPRSIRSRPAAHLVSAEGELKIFKKAVTRIADGSDLQPPAPTHPLLPPIFGKLICNLDAESVPKLRSLRFNKRHRKVPGR